MTSVSGRQKSRVVKKAQISPEPKHRCCHQTVSYPARKSGETEIRSRDLKRAKDYRVGDVDLASFAPLGQSGSAPPPSRDHWTSQAKKRDGEVTGEGTSSKLGTRNAIRRRRLPIGAAAIVLVAINLIPTSALAASSVPPSQSGTGWSIQKTASPRVKNGSLFGVSCFEHGRCLAVGSFNGIGGTSPLAELSGWAASTSEVPPVPNGGTHGSLEAVSCPSSSECVAVGSFTTVGGTQVPLSDEWNGSSWSVLQSQSPQGKGSSQLDGVSCYAVKGCMAVGTITSSRSDQAFAESWNGGTWALSTMTGIRKDDSSFADVTCTGPGFCVAVGSYLDPRSDDYAPLAEEWQRSSWQETKASSAPGSIVDQFQNITCTGVDFCIAVGHYINGNGEGKALGATLAEAWNGSTWTIEPTPSPGSGGDLAGLSGISCALVDSCVAVGYSTNGLGSSRPLTETWNGSDWISVKTAIPDGASSSLDEVSCTDYCESVGTYTLDLGSSKPLVETNRSGSWSQIAAPGKEGVAPASLDSVSCGSASSCVAVGSYEVSSTITRTFSEIRTGSRWSISRTPNTAGTNDEILKSVSCTSTTFCIAVGVAYTNQEASRPLAEVWNGVSWRVDRLPAPTESLSLDAVSCSSSSGCIAVGDESTATELTPVALPFVHGTAAGFETLPTPEGGYDPVLEGVSCSSTTSCTAVGSYTESAQLAALVVHWNGTRWSLQSAPTSDGYFVSVSCPSISSCVAVGNSYSYPSGVGTLAESWNGTTWMIEKTPRIPDSDLAELYGVSCESGSECTTVGGYDDLDTGRDVPLGESFENGKWTIDKTVNPPTSSYLQSLAFSTSESVISVGETASPGGVPLTLAEADSW